MTAKYKPYRVIGKSKPKPMYSMPDEAFTIREDIWTLELMLDLLSSIDPRSITYSPTGFAWAETKEESYRTMRRLAFIISEMKRIAETKFAHEFGAGLKITPRRRIQTLWNIWLEIHETIVDWEKANRIYPYDTAPDDSVGKYRRKANPW